MGEPAALQHSYAHEYLHPDQHLDEHSDGHQDADRHADCHEYPDRHQHGYDNANQNPDLDGDGHPDHEAVGRAAATAAHRTDALLWEYPVWWWHWGRPDDLAQAPAARLPLPAEAMAAKRAAVDAHESQVRPLSAAPGDEVLLGPDLLAHFGRDHEVFLVGGPEAGEVGNRGDEAAGRRRTGTNRDVGRVSGLRRRDRGVCPQVVRSSKHRPLPAQAHRRLHGP